MTDGQSHRDIGDKIFLFFGKTASTQKLIIFKKKTDFPHNRVRYNEVLLHAVAHFLFSLCDSNADSPCVSNRGFIFSFFPLGMKETFHPADCECQSVFTIKVFYGAINTMHIFTVCRRLIDSILFSLKTPRRKVIFVNLQNDIDMNSASV